MTNLEANLVAEHNQLIKAAARMGKAELKLFELIVAAIDTKDGDILSDTIRIPKAEVFQLLGISGNSRDRRLQETMGRLYTEARFIINERLKDGDVHTIMISPIRQIDWYAKRHEYLTVQLESKLKPWLMDLKQNYTQYRLSDIVGLQSKYAILLFRWLTMHYNQFAYYSEHKSRTGRSLDEFANPVIEVDELKRIFDVTSNESYQSFNEFRRRIIEPALKDISSNTPLTVTYDKLRVGRRIGKLQFHISRKGGQAKLATKQPSTPVDVTAVIANRYGALLIANALLDVAKLQADGNLQQAITARLFPAYDRFVKEHDFATLQKHVTYVGTHTAGTPDNLVPYLLEALVQYEEQLAKADKKPKQRKGKATEKLPEWAKKTDANERTEGPASEAQIQDSLDKLADFRKRQHRE